MKFRIKETDAVKMHSVRYTEVVEKNGIALLGGQYIPKTTLLKLTGGSDDWPTYIDMADILALEKPATKPATVQELRKKG